MSGFCIYVFQITTLNFDRRAFVRLVEKGAYDMTARPVLTIDYEKYEHFFEESDLTEAEKRAFIETIWSVIVSFVDMGFGVHPVQQAQEACGKLAKNPPKSALTAPDGLYLRNDITRNFKDAALQENAAGDQES